MQESDLKQIWDAYDDKLESVLQINHRILHELTVTKASKAIRKTKAAKYLGIILGILWVLFLDSLAIIGWVSGNWLFSTSLIVISLLTKIAIGTYIYHLILIHQIDHAHSVISVQERIAKLKTSSIQVTRIMALQLPFWTTWYLNTELLNSAAPFYAIVNILVVSLFCYFAYWLYTHIKVEYLDRKWMKWLFSDNEWKQLNYAGQLLDQLSDYPEDR